jgi:hypothetical protein
MNRFAVLTLCTGLSVLAGCAASVGMVRSGVYMAPDAKALAPSERAVMLQPDRTLYSYFGGAALWLSGGQEGEDFGHEYWAYPGLHVPERIELAPGWHTFEFESSTASYSCHFDAELRAGHVYKLVKIIERRTDYLTDNLSPGRPFKIQDTDPTGSIETFKVECLER